MVLIGLGSETLYLGFAHPLFQYLIFQSAVYRKELHINAGQASKSGLSEEVAATGLVAVLWDVRRLAWRKGWLVFALEL